MLNREETRRAVFPRFIFPFARLFVRRAVFAFAVTFSAALSGCKVPVPAFRGAGCRNSLWHKELRQLWQKPVFSKFHGKKKREIYPYIVTGPLPLFYLEF
jgi:hypothetical protein